MYFEKGKKNEFAMQNHILKVVAALEGAVTSNLKGRVRNIIKAQ